ncbi:MAG TPA: DUF1493 family protein [Chthoniobacteraceae bacterium]|nr:DUF1493 family protein [Chthoniobacteraceae bacterium]
MEERIIQFVAREVGVSASEVLLSSDLSSDLGVAGDDGVELMEKFASEFGVVLDGFIPGAFFGSEGAFNPFVFLFLFWRKRRTPKLTVQDLLDLAVGGSWKAFCGTNPAQPPA